MPDVLSVSSADLQNNFGRYLSIVMEGTQIIITKNGKQVARLIPEDAAVSYLTDSLTGVLKGNFDPDEAKDKELREKYEVAD